MAEFNLIPDHYILRRKFVSDFRVYLIFMTLLLSIAVVGRMLLQRDIQNQSNTVSELRMSRAYLTKQEAKLRDLLDSKILWETRTKLVNGLKGSLTVNELFSTLDRALSDDIELESWTFKRSGEASKQEQISQAASYFIVVDEFAQGGTGVDGLRITSEMILTGRAGSHSMMAGFMKQLLMQPEFEYVELVSSGNSPSGVKFEILIGLIPGNGRS